MITKGTIIKCHDEEDFEQTCEDLEADGFSTERIYPFHILITGVQEKKE
jgi:hypothetical protein